MRVQLGVPQRFIGINVSESGDELLIQQKRFQHAVMASETLGQCFCSKAFFQWFRTQTPEDSLRILCQMDSAEFAGIVKPQLPPVIEFYDDMFMLDARHTGFNEVQATGHPQMQQHGAVTVRLKDQMLTPAPNSGKFPASQPLAEHSWRRRSDRARPEHFRTANANADYSGSIQIIDDCLNLWQFGHGFNQMTDVGSGNWEFGSGKYNESVWSSTLFISAVWHPKFDFNCIRL